MKFDIIMVCPPWKRYSVYSNRLILGDLIPPEIRRELEAFEFIDQALIDFASPDHMVFVWVKMKNATTYRTHMSRLGYRVRGSMTWIRPKWKIGSTEKTVEFLMIFSKGKIPVLSDEYLNMTESAFTETVSDKLEKPKEAYQLLEKEFPDLRKLQLYGWTDRPGWTVFHKNDDKIK
jgi:N6-adenosine-specific RNA methylase IME4